MAEQTAAAPTTVNSAAVPGASVGTAPAGASGSGAAAPSQSAAVLLSPLNARRSLLRANPAEKTTVADKPEAAAKQAAAAAKAAPAAAAAKTTAAAKTAAAAPVAAAGPLANARVASASRIAGKWFDSPMRPDYDSLVVTVNTKASKARILQNFLGTSHEWGRLYEYSKTPQALAAFTEIFSELGPSPIMRIGGRSQELLRAVPSDEIFDALRALGKAVNVRFIIGLPLELNNAVLAQQILDKAKAYLGDKIVGYGLGNEPGGFCGVGGRRGGGGLETYAVF